jgi:hypothetical protein
MKVKTEWQDCVMHPGSDPICSLIGGVTALLDADYDNYQDVALNHKHTWTDIWLCTGAPMAKIDQPVAGPSLWLDPIPRELQEHRSEPALRHARLRRSEQDPELPIGQGRI